MSMRSLIFLILFLSVMKCSAQEDFPYSYNGWIRKANEKARAQLYKKNLVSSYSLYIQGIHTLTGLIDKEGREWKTIRFLDTGDTASITTAYFDASGYETKIWVVSYYTGKLDSTLFLKSFYNNGLAKTSLWINHGYQKYDSTIFTYNEQGDEILEKNYKMWENPVRIDSTVHEYKYDKNNLMIKASRTGSLSSGSYNIEIGYENNLVKQYTWRPGHGTSEILYNSNKKKILYMSIAPSGTKTYTGTKYLANGLLQLEGDSFYEYTYGYRKKP